MTKLFSTALAITAISTAAFADNLTTSTNTAKPAVPQTMATIPDSGSTNTKLIPISISTWSAVYGPALTAPTTKTSTDDSVNSTTGLDTRHQISFKYKISNQMSVTPVMDFLYSISDDTGKENGSFRWKDCFIKLSRSGIATADIGNSKFALDGDFRYFIPTALKARTNGTLGALQLSLDPSLQLGKSPVSLSMVNYVRFWMQQNDTTATGGHLDRLRIYAGPQVNYTLNNTVNAWVLYEAIQTFYAAGGSTADNPNNSLTDVEPGIDVKVHDRVTLTPFLNWYTNQELSTTTMNLQASIKLY